MKVLPKRLSLNGHIARFRPQTQKVELPHKTLGVNGLTVFSKGGIMNSALSLLCSI